MRLNAEIVFDNLRSYVNAELFGYKHDSLTLSRPEFYTDTSKPFLADHLYITYGERIPRRLTIEKGAVIICIGDAQHLSYANDSYCVIKVPSSENPFELSNFVNDIFNKYDAWAENLSSILQSNANLDEMISASIPIFQNPILALDSKFKIIACSSYNNAKDMSIIFESIDSNDLSVEALRQFLNESELQMDERDPILLHIMNTCTLSINLFDLDEYVGSLTIDYKNKPHKNSDDYLLRCLAEFLLAAMKKNSQIMISDKSILRKVFLDIIKDIPIDTASRKRLNSMNICRHFICAILQLNNRYAQVPIPYVCNKFESLFPKSIAFENHSNIITFIDLSEIEKGGDFHKELSEHIELLIGAMDIRVGLSNDFTDPYNAKLYYYQAQAALENGLLLNPNDKYFNFKEYALMELITNAQNNLPIDMYFPDGLKHLFEHDKKSATCYIETLRVYLDNNMGVTSTASALFIHRSTLLERLSRIERELGEDLKDPDVRLQIQIILKAIEIRDSVTKKKEN